MILLVLIKYVYIFMILENKILGCILTVMNYWDRSKVYKLYKWFNTLCSIYLSLAVKSGRIKNRGIKKMSRNEYWWKLLWSIFVTCVWKHVSVFSQDIQEVHSRSTCAQTCLHMLFLLYHLQNPYHVCYKKTALLVMELVYVSSSAWISTVGSTDTEEVRPVFSQNLSYIHILVQISCIQQRIIYSFLIPRVQV